jgi:hypothetical protein
MNLDLDLDIGVSTKPSIQVVDVTTELYPRMKEGEKAANYNCVIIDTVNELQNQEYLGYIDPDTNDMMTQKKYANLGIKLKKFVNQVREYRDPSNNGQAVLILGGEGTGKSFGVKYLNPRTTYWIHTDSKPATFKGSASFKPEHRNYMETTNYDEAKARLNSVYKRRDPSVPFIIFFMGHLEIVENKISVEYKEQLKTVGAFAHKLNIEGSFSNCFKTVVFTDPDTKSQSYCFDTHNSGHNTIRCQEDLFPGRHIPNNLEYVRQQIINW